MIINEELLLLARLLLPHKVQYDISVTAEAEPTAAAPFVLRFPHHV